MLDVYFITFFEKETKDPNQHKTSLHNSLFKQHKMKVKKHLLLVIVSFEAAD